MSSGHSLHAGTEAIGVKRYGVWFNFSICELIKRSVSMDKMEHILGPYAPSANISTRDFPEQESPSGIIARSGSYDVRSRVINDDGYVFAGLCFDMYHNVYVAHELLVQSGHGPSSWRRSGDLCNRVSSEFSSDCSIDCNLIHHYYLVLYRVWSAAVVSCGCSRLCEFAPCTAAGRRLI